MGGFGVSRYAFDRFLYDVAIAEGVDVIHENVEEIDINKAQVTICAHGKRSKLDYNLDRDFIHKRSPYVGVKYHIKIDHKPGLIALHNFKDGYCGISNVENGVTNLCYLTHRKNMRDHGNIRKMEEEVLFRNPFLKSIFERAEFLFEKPEVINEISFATKKPVEDHMLMVGDAAGMITPLCGNGMAMAIHSAKIVSEWAHKFLDGQIDRPAMETGYAREWKKMFASRLWTGRQVQRLFGSETASNVLVDMAKHAKPLANFLIAQTHGDVF
jgi:flavin-dependent dehydrogenase